MAKVENKGGGGDTVLKHPEEEEVMDKRLCYSTHLQERPLLFLGATKLSYFVDIGITTKRFRPQRFSTFRNQEEATSNLVSYVPKTTQLKLRVIHSSSVAVVFNECFFFIFCCPTQLISCFKNNDLKQLTGEYVKLGSHSFVCFYGVLSLKNKYVQFLCLLSISFCIKFCQSARTLPVLGNTVKKPIGELFEFFRFG